MVGSNKILTVSYGTFSCTLEGFDDSFHSMKAIAEYFRDLAQEDRYFGAEPPTPDAEMLARIAEREISRRVEAQMDERGIRLRAAPQVAAALDAAAEAGNADAEADAAPAAAETKAEVAMPPQPEAPAADTSLAKAFMATPAPKTETAPAPAAAPADPGSVAAKLQRIRAVVGQGAAPIEDAETEDYEDAPAMAFDDTEEVSADEDIITDAAPEVAPEVAEDEAAFDAEDAVAADDDTADDDMDVAADASDMDDDAEEVAAAEDDDIAAEDAEAAFEDTEETIAAEADEDIADADDTDDVSEYEDVSEYDDEEAQDVAWAKAALNQTDDTMEADDDVLEADADATDEDEDLSFDLNDIDMDLDEPKAATTSKARIVRIRKDGPAEVVLVDNDDADIAANVTARLKTEAEAKAADGASAEDDAEQVEADADDAMDAVAEDTSDTETYLPADEDAADAEHDSILAAVAAAMPTGSLSDEDEEDLQRELAAVAEEVVSLDEPEDDGVTEVVIEETYQEITVEETVLENDADDAEEVAAEAEAEEIAEDDSVEDVAEAEEEADRPEMPEVVQSVPKGRKRLPDADYAVTRMIAQTDEALNEPAGSRRRNAIAQLKAAVAATEAARQLGDRTGAGNTAENAFREDLDQVVRPSKPIETSQPIEAEAKDVEKPRASPLKLVASQRVDVEQPAKVTSRQSVDAGDVGGFAQFAASMGATELPDLLEAAAAYTSFVEGIEDFSRPQIMKKVQMTTTEEFSREDGLRSFGTLLRQGRISKVRNGRFQVSEQTRFRPDARSA